MPAKKHLLKQSDDTIVGKSGADLFLAMLDSGTATLGDGDVLNGKGGFDVIRAELSGDAGTPVMKSIEKGIFSLAGSSGAVDLQAAGRMGELVLRGTTNSVTSTLDVDNARSVGSVRLQHSSSKDEIAVEGLDPAKNGTLKVFLSDCSSSLGLFSADGNPFERVEVTLSGILSPLLWGSALSARELVIHSVGKAGNQLIYDPGMYEGTVRHLQVDGGSTVSLKGGTSEIFQHLHSVDLSGMKAATSLEVGGEKLTSYLGSSKADRAEFSSFGGTGKHKAVVDLGTGDDLVDMLAGSFDAARQRFDGGAGHDIMSFQGSVADLWKGIEHFERVSLREASGTYDLHKLDVDLDLSNTTGAITLERVKDGSKLTLLADLTTFLSIEVEGAAKSKTESFTLVMHGYMSDYGNTVVGLVAADLSELRILSKDVLHRLYLTTLGSETDGATLKIGGDSNLYVYGTDGSTSFIDRIIITNDAGVNLFGLLNTDEVLVSTGVTVVGGAGNDALVGGIGIDTISTGAGDNFVYGSLGEDQITLEANSGLDQIVYLATGESAFGVDHDTILNFGIFDLIDVYDIGDVSFVGNFADNASGIAALSTSQARAFFNTTTDTLYIDFDHDKALGPNHDMQVVLTGLDTFASGNLFS